MTTLSGILQAPDGTAIASAKITFEAVRNYEQVTFHASSSLTTGSDGSYSITLPVGSFNVFINYGTNRIITVGMITILDGSIDGTLNDYLLTNNDPAYVLDVLSRLGAAGGSILIGRCPDVATARTIEPTANKQKLDVAGYYSNSTVGGGSYVYDASDTTTLDDGILTLVTAGGKRWKALLSDGKITASRAGLITGADVTPLWKKFCQLPVDKVIDKTIYVSGVGILADRTNIEAINGSQILITASVNDQVTAGNEGSCLEAGDRSIIKNLSMDGQNFNGAGICVISKTGVLIDGCEMQRSYSIGVKNYLSDSTKITRCHIHSNRHGVLSQQSTNTIVSLNHVHNISWTSGNNGGGIWSSADSYLMVSDNIVYDCSDVGIDFEGGTNCKSFHNFVMRCRHGELTIFATGTSLTGTPVMGRNAHIGNIVIRDNFAYNKDGVSQANDLTDVGALMIYGTLDLIQDGEILFEDNKVSSVATTGNSLFCFRSRTSGPTGTARITFRRNTFSTASGFMGTLLDRQDLVFEDNILTFLSGTVQTTEIRDHRTLNFRKNTVSVGAGVATGNNVFTLNTAIAVVGEVNVVKNILKGFDGTWFYVSQINSGREVTFDDNDFADATGFVSSPIVLDTGGIVWKNQRLRYLRPTGTAINFASVAALFQSSFVCMDGVAWVMLDKSIKAGYRFALKCDKGVMMSLGAIDGGGAINTGRFPDPTSYATFLSNTISFTTTGAQSLSALVELTVNSVPHT